MPFISSCGHDGPASSRRRHGTLRLARAATMAAATVTGVMALAGVVELAGVPGTAAGASVDAATSRGPGLMTRSATTFNVLNAPTRVAHTADGTVGYREIGTGRPLVLIMGYQGSMDNWAPDFVDELAEAHTVVMLDNAGVGQTSAVTGTLTIEAMARQTSALLTALHLGPAAVLGWSMGGMTAQALAVLHPSQVTRLVLAATQVGNGKAVPVPAGAAADLASPDPKVVLSALFPPGQSAAARRLWARHSPVPRLLHRAAGRPVGAEQGRHRLDRGPGTRWSGRLADPCPYAGGGRGSRRS